VKYQTRLKLNPHPGLPPARGKVLSIVDPANKSENQF